MKSTAILIPARYESSRFHGKPLTTLGHKPMIVHVFEKCKQTDLDTYVLTDQWDIYKLFSTTPPTNLGHKPVRMTDNCLNGTERCSQAAQNLPYDYFVNVQGDMPDVTKEMIWSCIEDLEKYPISTVYTDMPQELKDDPNTVKLIRKNFPFEKPAVWFGRGFSGYGDWHIGVYGYRKDVLKKYPRLPIPEEEELEQLEQLRWIKNGFDIGCSWVKFDGIEINTPEDAAKWNERYK